MVSALYTFNSITFGTCGGMGRLGPANSSTCTASYSQYGSWTTKPEFLSVANGIQVCRRCTLYYVLVVFPLCKMCK